MSTLYVETSAILRVLLEGDDALRDIIASGERLLTSALTFVESDRGLRRAFRDARISSPQLREARRWLRAVERSCDRILLDDTVLDRAKQDFPKEPLRSLAALHLASALLCEETVCDVTVVSVDARVRENAVALGLDVKPATL